MGNDIQKGTIYAEGGVGGAGTVTAPNLNAHVDEARIKASFVSSKSLKDPASLDDSVIVENSGVLYRETWQQIIDLIGQVSKIPTGTVIDFAGPTPPDGWLYCAGQAVSRVTYDLLFAVLGTIWGVGDGSTTFNLPDLRGFVIAGRDDMNGTPSGRLNSTWLSGGGGPTALGGFGGVQAFTLTQNEMPNHAHMTNTPVHGHDLPIRTTTQEGGGGANYGLVSGGPYTGRVFVTSGYGYQATNTVDLNTATDNRGSGAAHTNLQPTRILNKIIRYL
jgi:microcystin-dependent protein